MSCEPCSACGCADGGCACTCTMPSLRPPSNRAGLDEIRARLGDQRDFFGVALERLGGGQSPSLRALGTHRLDDPSIALLDAWSVAADVLTFYRERLTNDAYLRTARDEHALREMAALVGYRPRPGVAATAHLAYLLDATAAPVEIPAGAKTQTVPAPGEQMQTFETDERFVARAEWNQMRPRLTKPPAISLADALLRSQLRLADPMLVVHPGAHVLFVFPDKGGRDSPPGFQVLREVSAARADIQAGHVELELKPRPGLTVKAVEDLERHRKAFLRPKAPGAKLALPAISSYFLGTSAGDAVGQLNDSAALRDLSETFKNIDRAFEQPLAQTHGAIGLREVLQPLRRPPARQLASARLLPQSTHTKLADKGADDRLALLAATSPELSAPLTATLDQLPASAAPVDTAPSVHLLRTTAGPFGAQAPLDYARAVHGVAPDHDLLEDDARWSFLDTAYERVLPASYAVYDVPNVKNPGTSHFEMRSGVRRRGVARVRSVQTVGRHAYAMSGRSTRLQLADLGQGESPVLFPPGAPLAMLRNTLYFVESEPAQVAPDPVEDLVAGHELVLDRRIAGLQAGQWLIVSGTRADIVDAAGRRVPGVQGTELAMIATVSHRPDDSVPGDTPHTTLVLVQGLAYAYLRSTVTVHGNVVPASHGETVPELLGSGDASRAGQVFRQKRGPLTFETAPTTDGVASTEVLRVNGLRYERVDSLLDAAADTRAYQMEIDANGAALFFFGDGVHAARLPSGEQNVRLDSRVGIGAAGNVQAGQISLLTTRPHGVSGVTNPLRAAGGADRDGPERIRRDAPLPALALSPASRLVSVEDHAVFARRFAGIGLADAVKLADGVRQLVHVTLAGIDDAPLDPDGTLVAQLQESFVRFGDPSLPVLVDVRERVVLVLEARVAPEPQADWDEVEPRIRQRLLLAFGAGQRRLGQPAFLSEVVAVIQGTPGVAWTDVDRFDGINEHAVRNSVDEPLPLGPAAAPWVPARRAQTDPEPEAGGPRLLAAQLVAFAAGLDGLLVLNQA